MARNLNRKKLTSRDVHEVPIPPYDCGSDCSDLAAPPGYQNLFHLECRDQPSPHDGCMNDPQLNSNSKFWNPGFNTMEVYDNCKGNDIGYSYCYESWGMPAVYIECGIKSRYCGNFLGNSNCTPYVGCVPSEPRGGPAIAQPTFPRGRGRNPIRISGPAPEIEEPGEIA